MTSTSNHDLHDLDLIAAHASGEIDPRAEALVSTCTQCRAEYDLQLQVREWLKLAPVLTMADHERSALQHRVSAQIGRSRTRAPGGLLFRIGAAAAGLAVVAGLSGVLGQLGRVTGAAATTTNAAGTVAATESMLAADDGDLTDAAGSAEDASATTAALAMAAPESRSLPGGDEAAVRAEGETLTEEAATAPAAGTAYDRVAAPPCVEEIEGLTPLLWAESVLEGEPVVIIVVEGEEAPEALVYSLDNCELIDLS